MHAEHEVTLHGFYTLTTCSRRVRAGHATKDLEKVTCHTCLQIYATISAHLLRSRERKVCPGCGYSDGVNNETRSCDRCGEEWT